MKSFEWRQEWELELDDWRVSLFALFAILVGADQLSKWYAQYAFATPVVVNDFLSFTLAYNRGISWGFFYSESTAGFVAVTLATCGVLALVARHAWQRAQAGRTIVPEVLVLSGAFSNLLDRFVHGGVVDFILLSYKGWSWPVFNLADAAIVCGVGLMLLTMMRR